MRFRGSFPLGAPAPPEPLQETVLERDRVEGDGSTPHSGECIVVAFDPGLVRVGRVVAREGSALEVEFPRRQPLTLAIGTRVAIGWCDESGAKPAELAIPDRECLATERAEEGDVRRYRLLLDADAPAAAPRRSPPRGHALRVDLRFGRMDYRAEVAAWPGQRIVLRVALETEAQLRATDAIELVHCRSDDAEIRLAGWIERRVLEGFFVRYEFRIDDRLAEDGAIQRLRLRSLLAGETRPGATQA